MLMLDVASVPIATVRKALENAAKERRRLCDNDEIVPIVN